MVVEYHLTLVLNIISPRLTVNMLFNQYALQAVAERTSVLTEQAYCLVGLLVLRRNLSLFFLSPTFHFFFDFLEILAWKSLIALEAVEYFVRLPTLSQSLHVAASLV